MVSGWCLGGVWGVSGGCLGVSGGVWGVSGGFWWCLGGVGWCLDGVKDTFTNPGTLCPPPCYTGIQDPVPDRVNFTFGEISFILLHNLMVPNIFY